MARDIRCILASKVKMEDGVFEVLLGTRLSYLGYSWEPTWVIGLLLGTHLGYWVTLGNPLGLLGSFWEPTWVIGFLLGTQEGSPKEPKNPSVFPKGTRTEIVT